MVINGDFLSWDITIDNFTVYRFVNEKIRHGARETLCIKSENWEFENPPKIPHLPEDLLAIPADKGGGVIVLERQFYLTAIEPSETSPGGSRT